jgi:hypothetical protein
MLRRMTTKSHWEAVYETKAADAVSWYAPHLDASLQYIHRAAPGKDAAIIDVGGGESTLVDDLLAAGYGKLTVLDISATALQATRHRLGPTGESVTWIAADVLSADLPAAAFDVWHDRAVFHQAGGRTFPKHACAASDWPASCFPPPRWQSVPDWAWR